MKKMIMFLVSLTFLILQGCSHNNVKRELNDLAIVLAIGIDRGVTEKGKIDVVAQIAEIGSVGAAGSGGKDSGSKEPVWNLKMHGDDIFTVLRSALQTSSRKLYISHNQILIFGQEQALEGINDHIDWFFRDHETRYTTLLLIARGRSEEVLEAENHLDKILTQRIVKLLYTQKQISMAPVTTLFDYMSDLYKEGCCSLVPLIGVDDDNELYIEGAAVMDDGKMVGTIEGRETRGFLWMKGKVESGVIVAAIRDDVEASVEILENTRDFSVTVDEENRVCVNVSVKVQGVINHISDPPKTLTKEMMKEFETSAGKAIEDEIQAALASAVELNADFIGIEDYLYTFRHSDWLRIKEYDLLEGLRVNVDADVVITHTGSLVQTLP